MEELRPTYTTRHTLRGELWCEGRTGYPIVDACMRLLRATGWLNFRMRAMLVGFAAYHLWPHWREPGRFLARQFLDFEPGIHWSQMQRALPASTRCVSTPRAGSRAITTRVPFTYASGCRSSAREPSRRRSSTSVPRLLPRSSGCSTCTRPPTHAPKPMRSSRSKALAGAASQRRHQRSAVPAPRLQRSGSCFDGEVKRGWAGQSRHCGHAIPTPPRCAPCIGIDIVSVTRYA